MAGGTGIKMGYRAICFVNNISPEIAIVHKLNTVGSHEVKYSGIIIEAVNGYYIICASGIPVFSISPVGWLFFACPEPNGGFIPAKQIVDYFIPLTMFNGYRNTIVSELVAFYPALVAITTPYAVITLKYPVAYNFVSAKSNLDAIGGSIGKIILNDQVVIAPALAIIHRCLTCPEKETIPAMRNIIPVKYIIAALFIDQYTSTILSPIINTMTIPPYIKNDPVVDNTVPAAAIHTNPYPGIKRKIIVGDPSIIASCHHQRILSSRHPAPGNIYKIAVTQVYSRTIPHPFILFIMVITHPV